MKKTLILGAILFSLSSNAQQKESKIIDTTIQVNFSLNEYKALLSVLESNIDSKKLTKELIDFLNSKVQIIADKPKQIK